MTRRRDPATLAALTADPANRRKHDQRNLDAIAASLKDVGAARSIVIDEDHVILAGNGVVQAARTAGLTKLRIIEAAGDEIIAVRRRGLTDAQKRALAIADNRTSELASWNVEQLLADQAAGLELGAWWTDEELAALLTPDGAPKEGKTDPDAVPEVRATTIQRGDLFALGAHRLLCGDSTVAADVARVMDGAQMACMFTSPPYNQDLKSQATPTGMHTTNAWFRRLKNAYADAMPEDAYQSWQVEVLDLWFTHVAEGGACFYNHKHRYRDRRPIIPLDWIRRTRWVLRQEIVWDRRGGVAANAGMFIPGDERIYWLEKDGPHTWDGVGENRTTVWPISPQANDDAHVCPYPIEIVTTAVKPVTKDGDLVGEPFAGSGTTLIACEQLTRACRALEIEPQYVQVALDRWEAFTGQRATKVGEITRHTITNGRIKKARAAAAPPPAPQPPARRRREKA